VPLQNLVLQEYTAGLCVAFNDRVVSMPVQLFLQSAVVMKLVGGGLVAHHSNLGAAVRFRLWSSSMCQQTNIGLLFV